MYNQTSEPEQNNVYQLHDKRNIKTWQRPILYMRENRRLLILLMMVLAALIFSLYLLFTSSDANTDLATEQRAQLEAEISSLNQQLEANPTPAEQEQLLIQITQLEEELSVIESQLSSQQQTAEQLNSALEATQAELDLAIEAEAEALAELDAAEARIYDLTSSLEAEIAAIPTRLTAAMSYAAPRVETHFTIDETWKVERRLWGGLNDEVHQLNSQGTAVYGMIEGPTSAEWLDETLVVTLWLPEMKDAYFRLEAVQLNQNPGFLASYGQLWGDETDMSPLFEQAQSALDEVACTELDSLREYILRMEASVIDMAGGHDTTIYWRDKYGFRHSQISDELLLDSAC